MIDGKRSTQEVDAWDFDQLDAFLGILDMRNDYDTAQRAFQRKETEQK